MSSRGRKRQTQEVRLTEDILAEIDELLDLAKERGRAAREGDTGKRVLTTRADKANLDDFLRGELRQALEDEIVPATEADDTSGMLEWELRREITKKALIGLKLPTLRGVAAEKNLDKRGRAEDVAERIARFYKFDEQAIAQLILDAEDEPEPERGLADRLFPIDQPVKDLAGFLQDIRPVVHRYIRVGLARWFVLEDADDRNGALRLNGKIRSYRAHVESEGDEPQLGSSVIETPVGIEIRKDNSFLRLRRGNAAASRSAARAIESAGGLQLLGRLPIEQSHGGGRLATFEPRTVVMLDILHNRLGATIARSPNLTMARFEMSAQDDATENDDPDRPSLKAVRFEGSHLLDSVSACRLIAIDGRALVHLSLLVVANPDGSDEPGEFPIRISLDRDHATLVTGYGTRPDLALRLHRELLAELEAAILQGATDPSALESFATRIHDLAQSGEASEKAVMLRSSDDS